MGATALTVFSAGTALAQDNNFTPAGELVSNTFTLNYQVNNTPQTEIDNTGTPTIFNVDRLVNVTVSSQGNTSVIADQDNAELPFVVVNNGNDSHAYLLAVEQETSGDQFDTTAATIAPDIIYFVDADDTDADGILSAAERAAATPVDYDPANPPVLAADERAFVFVRQNIPAGQDDADQSGVILSADTRDPVSFADVIADADATNDADATLVENVLADLLGDATGDVAEDGTHSDTGFYIIENPNVAATKEVFGVSAAAAETCDAIALGASYAVPTANTEFFTPGSCVEYVIEVTNDGTTGATDIVLTDILPANLTFQEAAVRGDLIALPADLTQPSAGTPCDGTVTSACTVTVSNATLAAASGGTPSVGFLVIRATIN